MALPDVDYGEIKGTVLIDGQPVERELVAVSYATFDVEGSDDGSGSPIQARQVIGETASLADGSYVMAMAGFFDETIIIALPNYGEFWKPNRSYTVGDRIRPTTGNETGYVYECTIDGVSDAIEPTWWIDDGGTNTGAVGTATFKAIESWWPVAHAPIVPTYISVTAPPEMIDWTPAEITTTVWLDAADSGTITESLGEVSQWNDKSGNSLHAEQATGSAQPTIVPSSLNGMAAIEFDGSNDFMALPVHNFGNETSLYMVARAHTLSGDRTILNRQAASSSDKAVYQHYVSSSGSLKEWRSGAETGDSTIAANGWFMFGEVQAASNSVECWLAGLPLATGTSEIGWPGSTTLHIGKAQSNGALGWFSGDIAEIVIIQGAATDAERQKVEGYLAWKWGMEADLPLGHPYENEAPQAPA